MRIGMTKLEIHAFLKAHLTADNPCFLEIRDNSLDLLTIGPLLEREDLSLIM
jgi:hypothetical protein